MDEAQVRALITEALTPFKAEIETAINTANQGVAATLTREIKALKQKAEAPKSTEAPKADDKPADDKAAPSLETQALKTQLAELQKQFEESRKAAIAAAADAAFSDVILSSGALNPNALKTIFQARVGDKLEQGEDGKWFVKDGDAVVALDAFTQKYLDSEEGKFFKPASQVKGAGSTEGRKPTAAGPSTSQKAGVSASDAINQAFADI